MGIIATLIRSALGRRTVPKPRPAPRPEALGSASAGRQPERATASDWDLRLTGAASAWLKSLPARVRPNHLAHTFPRIANRLALCWADRALTETVFVGLLVDKRGGRKGFPPAVSTELVRLHEHRERRLDASADPQVAPLGWTGHLQATADRRAPGGPLQNAAGRNRALRTGVRQTENTACLSRRADAA